MSIFDEIKAQTVPDYIVNDDYLSEAYGPTAKDAYAVLEDDFRISELEEENARLSFVGPLQVFVKDISFEKGYQAFSNIDGYNNYYCCIYEAEKHANYIAGFFKAKRESYDSKDSDGNLPTIPF